MRQLFSEPHTYKTLAGAQRQLQIVKEKMIDFEDELQAKYTLAVTNEGEYYILVVSRVPNSHHFFINNKCCFQYL